MDTVAEIVEMLQRAFPVGLAGDQYSGTLAALHDDMSDEILSKAIAQVTGKHRLEVLNDIAAVVSHRRPALSAVVDSEHRLREAGWTPEDL